MKPVVLLIEDDEHVARVVTRALGRHYQIEHASTLADALRLVEAGGYVAILSDWDLVDGNAGAALKRSAELHPEAKRVIHSGHGDDVAKELPPGVADVVLNKPCSPDQIVRALGVVR